MNNICNITHQCWVCITQFKLVVNLGEAPAVIRNSLHRCTHTHTPLCGQLQWSAVYCVTTTSGKKYIMELLLQFVFAPWAPPLCSGDIYRAKLFWSLVTSQVTLHMQRNINWKTAFNIPLMINFFWAPNSCKTTLSLLYLLLYAYFCTWQYFFPSWQPLAHITLCRLL